MTWSPSLILSGSASCNFGAGVGVLGAARVVDGAVGAAAVAGGRAGAEVLLSVCCDSLIEGLEWDEGTSCSPPAWLPRRIPKFRLGQATSPSAFSTATAALSLAVNPHTFHYTMASKSTPALTALLTSSLTRCDSLLSSLSAPAATNPSFASEPNPLPALSDVRHDFVSLSALLGKAATELSLALKPPVSVSAAEGTLVKVGQQLGQLAFCLEQLPVGGALTQEIK